MIARKMESECSTTAAAFSMPASVRFVAKNYHSLFTERLVSLRQSNILTDITLKSGDIEIPCHKVVLCAASAYFNTMFCSGYNIYHQDTSKQLASAQCHNDIDRTLGTWKCLNIRLYTIKCSLIDSHYNVPRILLTY